MDYHKKKEFAAMKISSIIKELKKNPEQVLTISWLTIQFQEAYGFSEKIVRKLLEPYVTEGLIDISGNEIFNKEKK